MCPKHLQSLPLLSLLRRAKEVLGEWLFSWTRTLVFSSFQMIWSKCFTGQMILAGSQRVCVSFLPGQTATVESLTSLWRRPWSIFPKRRRRISTVAPPTFSTTLSLMTRLKRRWFVSLSIMGNVRFSGKKWQKKEIYRTYSHPTICSSVQLYLQETYKPNSTPTCLASGFLWGTCTTYNMSYKLNYISDYLTYVCLDTSGPLPNCDVLSRTVRDIMLCLVIKATSSNGLQCWSGVRRMNREADISEVKCEISSASLVWIGNLNPVRPWRTHP